MPEEIKAIGHEDKNGNIQYTPTPPSKEAKSKNIERAKVNTFGEFMKWVEKYYKPRLS
jgi:hypothetical protein